MQLVAVRWNKYKFEQHVFQSRFRPKYTNSTAKRHLPPTKASPAPLVSTISSGFTGITGYSVTVSPAGSQKSDDTRQVKMLNKPSCVHAFNFIRWWHKFYQVWAQRTTNNIHVHRDLSTGLVWFTKIRWVKLCTRIMLQTNRNNYHYNSHLPHPKNNIVLYPFRSHSHVLVWRLFAYLTPQWCCQLPE